MPWLFLVTTLASSVAYAQEAAEPSFLMQMAPILAMLVIMYFLMFRPQIKKQRQHSELLGALKKGDEVLTSGGIFGTIEGLTDRFVTLEVSNGVRIRVLRNQIGTTVKQEGKQ